MRRTTSSSPRPAPRPAPARQPASSSAPRAAAKPSPARAPKPADTPKPLDTAKPAAAGAKPAAVKAPPAAKDPPAALGKDPPAAGPATAAKKDPPAAPGKDPPAAGPATAAKKDPPALGEPIPAPRRAAPEDPLAGRLKGLPSYADLKREATTKAYAAEGRPQPGSLEELLERRQTPARDPRAIDPKECMRCHPKREEPSYDLSALRPPPKVDLSGVPQEIDRRFEEGAKGLAPGQRADLAGAYAERLRRPDPFPGTSRGFFGPDPGQTAGEARAASDQFRVREAERLRTAAAAQPAGEQAALRERADRLVRTPLDADGRKALADLERAPTRDISHRDAKAGLELLDRHKAANHDSYDRGTGLAPGHKDMFLQAGEEHRLFDVNRWAPPEERAFNPALLRSPGVCVTCHPKKEERPLDLRGLDAFMRGGDPLKGGRGDLLRALSEEPPKLGRVDGAIDRALTADGAFKGPERFKDPKYTAERDKLRAEWEQRQAIMARPGDPTARLKIPEQQLTPEQKKVLDDHQHAFRTRQLEGKLKPHFEQLDKQYRDNGWGEDSPFYGADREAFLADVNGKDPKVVSRYDGFRALSSADGFRKDNPEVFKARAGDFTSRGAGSELYYKDLAEIRGAQLDAQDLAARERAILADPQNPIAYLRKPLADLKGEQLDQVNRDYTRYGVEQLEGRMRQQVVAGVGKEVDRLDKHFDRILREQGVVGSTADWIKNNLGAKDGWVIDSERGSNAVLRSLQQAYQARADFEALGRFSGDNAAFTAEYQKRATALQQSLQGVAGHIQKFNESQRSWVEGISDFASVAAAVGGAALAPVSGGASLALGVAIGASVKVGVKGLDAITGSGQYDGNVFVDALKGGLNGGSGVGTNMLARAASQKLLASAGARLAAGETIPLLTRAGVFTGTRVGEGAIDGYITQAGGSLLDGKGLLEANANGLRGAAFGAVLNPLAQGATTGLGKLWKGARGADLPATQLDDLAKAPRLGQGAHSSAYDLGDGSVGVVFQHADPRLGGKVLDPARAAESAAHLTGQLDYMQSLRGLNFEGHGVAPRIQGVIKDGAGNVVGYRVEKIAGEPLGDLAQRGRLSDAQFQEVERQIRAQQKILHDAGKMHGDPNPNNILVDLGQDGSVRARFLDFEPPSKNFGLADDKALFDQTLKRVAHDRLPDNVAAFHAGERAKAMKAAEGDFLAKERASADGLRDRLRDLRRGLPEDDAAREMLGELQRTMGLGGKETRLWTAEDLRGLAGKVDAQALDRLRKVGGPDAPPALRAARDALVTDLEAAAKRWGVPAGEVGLPKPAQLTPEVRHTGADPAAHRALVETHKLQPQHSVVVDNVHYSFSDPFDIGGGRVGVLGVVDDGTGQTLRAFYRSNSQGNFRLLPAQNEGLRHMGLPGFDKGGGEHMLGLPAAAEAKLAGLVTGGRMRKDIPAEAAEKLFGGAAPVNKTPIDYVGYARAPDYIGNQVKAEKLVTAADGAERLRVGGGHELLPPKAVQVAKELQPDFGTPSRTYKTQTATAGEVEAMVFPSQNGALEWTLFKDQAGRVWVANVGALDGRVTNLGVRAKAIDTGELTTPLWEYRQQIPPGFIGDAHPGLREYSSAWKYVRELEVIKNYYQARGLAVPE